MEVIFFSFMCTLILYTSYFRLHDIKALISSHGTVFLIRYKDMTMQVDVCTEALLIYTYPITACGLEFQVALVQHVAEGLMGLEELEEHAVGEHAAAYEALKLLHCPSFVSCEMAQLLPRTFPSVAFPFAAELGIDASSLVEIVEQLVADGVPLLVEVAAGPTFLVIAADEFVAAAQLSVKQLVEMHAVGEHSVEHQSVGRRLLGLQVLHIVSRNEFGKALLAFLCLSSSFAHGGHP
mmetsp:Transcript_21815/g.32490  ORF Transcript_21815/g.32490 Transcript_21815/m.32490 type:complete len:237 (+) Transcript_21815:16-726(+)